MTAEAAVALPVLVAFAMGLVWALLTAAAQIQCVDAARVGARAAARQEPRDAVIAAVKEAAPRGARVEVRRSGELVKVRVVAESPGPGPLSVDLEHEAVALAEETVGQGTGAERDQTEAGPDVEGAVPEPRQEGAEAEEAEEEGRDERQGAVTEADARTPRGQEGAQQQGVGPRPADGRQEERQEEGRQSV